jgi:hypothetical protein
LAFQTDTQTTTSCTPFEIPCWRAIVQFVLSAGGGLTGEISTMLNNAAELAIRNGDELIDMTHLEHVCRITQ